MLHMICMQRFLCVCFFVCSFCVRFAVLLSIALVCVCVLFRISHLSRLKDCCEHYYLIIIIIIIRRSLNIALAGQILICARVSLTHTHTFSHLFYADLLLFTSVPIARN